MGDVVHEAGQADVDGYVYPRCRWSLLGDSSFTVQDDAPRDLRDPPPWSCFRDADYDDLRRALHDPDVLGSPPAGACLDRGRPTPWEDAVGVVYEVLSLLHLGVEVRVAVDADGDRWFAYPACVAPLLSTPEGRAEARAYLTSTHH